MKNRWVAAALVAVMTLAGTVPAVANPLHDILINTPAHTPERRADRLMAWCTGEDLGMRGFCYGYMRGGMDATAENNTDMYCLPESLTAEGIAGIYVAFVERNPHLRHVDMQAALAVAVLEVYPCMGREAFRAALAGEGS